MTLPCASIAARARWIEAGPLGSQPVPCSRMYCRRTGLPTASAEAVGKPVRLQYMREQGTGWDPKGPASIHRARAAIDAQGNVIAYDFLSKGFSRVDVDADGGKLCDTPAGPRAYRSACCRWRRRPPARIPCLGSRRQ